MERARLPFFYNLGNAAKALKQLTGLEKPVDIISHLLEYRFWFDQFGRVSGDMDLPLSKGAAEAISKNLDYEIQNYLKGSPATIHSATFSKNLVPSLKGQIEQFELFFARESERVSVFSIPRKGLYDTRLLMEEGEKKFAANLVAVMPQNVIDDLREASNCMALDRATACGFHVCRATEGLMRAYYKKLSGFEWPNRQPPDPPFWKDWKVLVDQLRVLGAPSNIIQRLGELREDRNAYAHPDVSVPVDEAPVVYEICTFAMFYIAKEML